MNEIFDLSTLERTIEAAKTVAKRYRELTGRPLGITGEIGEVQTARLLELQLADARQAGYDALGTDDRRVQIKARCVLPDAKPGQRLGSIRLDHQWDSVVLILMNQDFEPLAIYEAGRAAVERELRRPGSKARNERGALAVSKFKAIGELRWSGIGAQSPDPLGAGEPMQQDAESGRTASEYGFRMARNLAPLLGARMLGKNSNECRIGDRRGVIKCAHRDTDSIGVTYKMLERVDLVIAALEIDDGAYALYEIDPAFFRSKMRDGAGSGRGKVGMLRRREILAAYTPHLNAVERDGRWERAG